MSDRSAKIDYLIVGQGVAGSVLAHALLARGCRVVVADVENRSAASRVAAGLITPVAGRKFVPTWRGEDLLPFARQFYRKLEVEFETALYFEKPIWRFFASKEEAEIWKTKRNLPQVKKQTENLPVGSVNDFPFQPGLDGFAMPNGAHIDSRKFLNVFRKRLREREALVEKPLAPEDLKVEKDRVQWREFSARKVIFCEGHRVSENPFFSWLPFQHAKGEVLTVAIESLPENVILNRRKWLLPIGGGKFLAGATYDSVDLSENRTDAGREEILEGIGKITPAEPTVLEHEAGVRPAVKGMRPVAGLHPGHPTIGIFNGLGSKGFLWAPFFAEQLAASLENGNALDPEIDVRRNL